MNAQAHLEAVRALLQQQLGYPWWLGYADKTSSQYGVLTGPAWEPGEPALTGPGQLLDTEFRVKAVTGTVAGVGIMLANARTLLWPNQHTGVLPLDGWHVETSYRRSEFVDVDESVVLPTTNHHPAFGVDSYRLVAEPDGSVPVVVETGADGVEIEHDLASSWTIPHTLGRIPVVAIYIDGHEVNADVYATDLVVVITFPAPVAGTAVLT